MKHCPWHTEGGRVNTPRTPREMSLCQREQGEKWEGAAALVSLLLPPIKCPGLREIQHKVLVGGVPNSREKLPDSRGQLSTCSSARSAPNCITLPLIIPPSSCSLKAPQPPTKEHWKQRPPQLWAGHTHPPPHRGLSYHSRTPLSLSRAWLRPAWAAWC